MATESPDRTLEDSTTELLDVLRDVESAIEPPTPGRVLRPPTPQGLLEFTSEVAIPGAILILRTNIAALELLQRTLRMIDGNQEARSRPIQDRAATVSRTSLARLETALSDLQTVIDARSLDREPDDVLAEARRKTADLEAQLAALEDQREDTLDDPPRTNVDVDAEIASLKQSVDGDDDPPDSGQHES